MIIRCWGARGSIPVSGREYMVYGGSTTCLEVQTGDDQIIILDAGTGIRKLGQTLLREKRHDLHLLFTHAHWDHLMGFPFFGPLYVAGIRLRIFGCPFAQDSIRGFLSPTMAAPNFPVDLTAVKATIDYHSFCQEEFRIGSATITPILLSHPNRGIGYKLTEDGKRFVFLTDNELTFIHPGGLAYEDYLRFASGADLLLHDAEFTPAEYEYKRTWGHSVYTDALRLALEAGVARFGLFHHNQERSDEDVTAMVSDCQRILDEKGSSLDCFAAHEGMEIELQD
jgi:phosphoribosyl 1,2-cyclic phosphodiesterase